MVVDTTVLVHDIRYFVIAYSLAVASAFLPPDLAWLKYVVAAVLIGIYAWYVKGYFTAGGTSSGRSWSRSASGGSTGGGWPGTPGCRASGSSGSRWPWRSAASLVAPTCSWGR